MRIRELILLFALLSGASVSAQILTDSNLPIVVIETDGGVTIPDEPKVPATMKIIWHQDGSRNSLSDIDNLEFLNYDGRIGIERRGSTSQMYFNKKPYGLETLQEDGVTNNNVSILGMPPENDWVLNSLAFDQTGMRDFLAYELSEHIGQYAPRRVYCEVMINGDYKGLYVFMEKIKRDQNRVNIEEMDATCNSHPEVTGGYITKADRGNGDPVAWTMQGYGGGGWWGNNSTDFIHHYPKPADITAQQNNYIHGVFNVLADVANRHDENDAMGLPSVIDIPSFVDFMMIAEYTSNVDVYSLSTFFHKDRNGKLRAGPVWDYNLAFGYDAFGSRSRYDVWQFDNNDNTGPRFWKDLFDTGLFRCYLAKRWFELTEAGQPLNYDFVINRIDEINAVITEAVGRDNQRWNQMAQHEQSVNDMKSWLQQRTNWLNNHFGSYDECDKVDLPPLVISKIHYHPMDWWGIDGDRLEFVEITNNGDETVDLTGVYFRELSVTYGFPNGASIGGRETLVLCSDSLIFSEYYGIAPYGQYSRKLSNKSENLVLADAWGNIIDEVHYLDTLPWPPEADGQGPFLMLQDLDADNSLPESWTLGDDLTATKELAEASMHLFPNPTSGDVHITGGNIDEIQVYNTLGQLVKTYHRTNTLHLSDLAQGIYILHLTDEKGATRMRKVMVK
ncbi:MAG: CotH kinase family protein [Bacteroidales bacterium]|nr:CotH kinase family protein [Bacteroidales bacterium]